MHFGMPTLVELSTLEENIRLCTQLGLQFVELNMNLPEYADLARVDKQRLMRAMREDHVYFTLHMDERMDVCDSLRTWRRPICARWRKPFALRGKSAFLCSICT